MVVRMVQNRGKPTSLSRGYGRNLSHPVTPAFSLLLPCPAAIGAGCVPKLHNREEGGGRACSSSPPSAPTSTPTPHYHNLENVGEVLRRGQRCPLGRRRGGSVAVERRDDGWRGMVTQRRRRCPGAARRRLERRGGGTGLEWHDELEQRRQRCRRAGVARSGDSADELVRRCSGTDALGRCGGRAAWAATRWSPPLAAPLTAAG